MFETYLEGVVLGSFDKDTKNGKKIKTYVIGNAANFSKMYLTGSQELPNFENNTQVKVHISISQKGFNNNVWVLGIEKNY